MPMPHAQADLVERIRTAFADEPVQREMSMFGGRAFMVDETLIASAGRDGSLLVRINPDDNGRLLNMSGTSPAEMGTGRLMGPQWITVDSNALSTDAGLEHWLRVALDRLSRLLEHRGGRSASGHGRT